MDIESKLDEGLSGVKPVRAFLRDVAAAAHCSVPLVSQKRARGKSDAQIIREGVARWKRQQRDAAAGEAKRVEATAIVAEDEPTVSAELPAELDGLTYAEAQRRKEIELYRRQKLANDEAEAKLLDADEVTTAWHEMISTAKSRMMLIPDELGDRLASESNPIRCREMIREKVFHALEALAEQAA
jgi:hypothetical protein